MRRCDAECVPSLCAVSEVYHCSGNGSWVNEVLGTELPKCIAGNQGSDLGRERVLRCVCIGSPSKRGCNPLGKGIDGLGLPEPSSVRWRQIWVWICQGLNQLYCQGD